MTHSLRQALNRLRAFFRKEPLDSDLDREMAAHLNLAIEENLERGMSVEEARRQALVRFGGVERTKEQHREARGLPALDILMQDLRYAFRTLRRDRAFTLIAVLILALGIGANIAVFSVVNTILLRPLPFQDPERLVRRDGGLQFLSDAGRAADVGAAVYAGRVPEERFARRAVELLFLEAAICRGPLHRRAGDHAE